MRCRLAFSPAKKGAMIDCGEIYRTFTGARTWDFALYGAKINRSVTRLRRAWFPCGTVSRLAGAHSSGCDWWRVAKIALSKSVNPHWGRWESKGPLATSAPAFVFAVRPHSCRYLWFLSRCFLTQKDKTICFSQQEKDLRGGRTHFRIFIGSSYRVCVVKGLVFKI